MLELKRTDGITEGAYMLELYQLVQSNMKYIRSMNKHDADEIAARVVTHAVQHRNREMTGTLNAYVRSLAASFSKEMHAQRNNSVELDDYTIHNNSNLYDSKLLWVSHEVSYDIVGRKTITESLSTQYLLTPAKVVDYCNEILSAVAINTDMILEEPTAQEIAELKHGTTWDVVMNTLKRYTPATILQGVLDTVQVITKQQRLQHKQVAISYRNYNAVVADEKLLNTITNKPTVAVLNNNGVTKFYGIHKYTFDMQEIDGREKLHMDFTTWLPVSDCGFRAVYAIDISNLMNYLYAQVVVPSTRNTQLVRFLGKERNAKYLPSGTVLLNETTDNYFIEVKMELLTMLLSNGMTEILGITDDNIYVRPARRPHYNVIRYTLFNGKQIDMPLTVMNIDKQKANKNKR